MNGGREQGSILARQFSLITSEEGENPSPQNGSPHAQPSRCGTLDDGARRHAKGGKNCCITIL